MARSPRKWLYAFLVFDVVLICLYFLGPRPSKPDFSKLTLPSLPSDLQVMEDSIRRHEALQPLKADNDARIVWAKPYEKTSVAIVYLHGNAASQEEGDPIHEALAHRYGFNMYMARLEGHGMESSDPLLDLDAEKWMQSALNAIAIGQALGDSVVVLSCSTGSTFALYLSSVYPELIDVHLMMSPNIDLVDSRSFLLVAPWGLQIARGILDGKLYGWKAPGRAQQYWYPSYRIEGLITLKSILNATMTEKVFEKIHQPLWMSYYYRDDQHQDDVVSVPHMLDMYEQVKTPEALKSKVAVQHAGTHIIGSDLFNDNLDEVWQPLVKYCEEVLKWKAIDSTDWRPFLDAR